MTTEPDPVIEDVYLYGEIQDSPVPDLIHCEPLETRSMQHGWVIKPHRHKSLVQLFHLCDGQAIAHLDSETLELSVAGILVVPELCVHDFAWTPGSRGHVLFIAKPLLVQLDRLMGTEDWGTRSPAYHHLGEDRQFIDHIFSSILREYRQAKSNRELILESLVRCLGVWLSRKSHAASPMKTTRDRGYQHFSRFSRLVEDHYITQPPISWYAAQLGITASHLSAVCQQNGGARPQGHLPQSPPA